MERRKYNRIVKRFDVRFAHDTRTMDHEHGETRDVAFGGICLRTDKVIPAGSRTKFSIRQSESDEWIPDIDGIVAWQKATTEETRRHVTGISFSSDQVGINRVIGKLMDLDSVDAEDDELIEPAYDGSKVTFKLLRCFGWGGLNNLGYFKYPSPISFLNIVESFIGGKMLYLLPDSQRRLVKKTSELMDLTKGNKVLDIACGKGMSSFLISGSHPDTIVTGIDLLQRNISASQSLFGGSYNLRFTKDNAMHIDYADETFDKACCIEAAFHFADRKTYLEEAFRVLKPGGRLVHVDFMWKSNDARLPIDDEAANLVKQQWEWTDFSSIDEYEDYAKSAGFKIAGIKNWSRAVAGPLECTFKTVAFMGNFKIGRSILCQLNPLLNSLDDAEWKLILKSALAHNHVRKRIDYMALVLDKKF